MPLLYFDFFCLGALPMKFNSGSPDDRGVRRDTAPNFPLTVITVVAVAEFPTIPERRRSWMEEPTLTERVLLFLDRRAA